jgi:hypothetical protein
LGETTMAPFKHKTGSRQVSTQTWRGVLPVHPAAELLPAMTDVELRDLGEDIRKHGQRIPITTLTDQEGVERLLDGRSRLDAMERLGMPIVRDGHLNRDQLDIQSVSGNVDPYAYVLSANVHRRHLTTEQKRTIIVALLKAQPHKSNRQIANAVQTSHPYVAKVRRQSEKAGDVETVTTSVDTKGRKQPAKKRKSQAEEEPMTPAASESAAAETEAVVTSGSPCTRRVRVVEAKASSETEAVTPIAPAEAEQEEAHSMVFFLETIFKHLWEECGDIRNWPDLSAGRKDRVERVMSELKAGFSELIKLATPAKPRGRPRNVKAQGCAA